MKVIRRLDPKTDQILFVVVSEGEAKDKGGMTPDQFVEYLSKVFGPYPDRELLGLSFTATYIPRSA